MPTGRERNVLLAVIAGSVVDLIINLWLIPTFGSCGATIGTLVAEFVVVLIEAVVLRQFLKEIWQIRRIVPYMLALIPSVAAAVALHKMVLQNTGNFLTLVFTAIVFFCLYGVALLLQKETITMEFVLPYVRKLLLTKKAS